VVSQDASSAALSTPSKTYPLLASGVPVLALTNEGSDLAGVVTEGGGYLVPHAWSPQRAADAIGEWVHGGDLETRREAARDLAVSTYSEEAVTAAMREALRAVFP
jgi:glycosyltransferase involved in cell wall biosynthesis